MTKTTTVVAAAMTMALAAITGMADDTSSFADMARIFRTTAHQKIPYEAPKALRIVARHGALAKVAVELRDEDGSPVEGAIVTLETKAGDKAVTGADGRAVFEGILPATVPFKATGGGIYSRDGEISLKELSDDGQRWTAPDTFPLTVRRRGVAHPMSVRKVASSRFPPANAVMSYDLFKDDFLPPHGNGEAADFTILYSHVSDSPPWDNGNGNFASRLEIVPAGETEGFAALDKYPDSHGLPLVAPEKTGGDTIHIVGRMVRGQVPEPSYDTTASAGKAFAFKARGRYGIATLEGIDGSYVFAKGCPFTISFLVNDESGERGLEAAEQPAVADAQGGDAAAAVAPPPGKGRDPGAPLLARTGSDSAKYFGTGEQGGIIPAAFAADAIDTLDGIATLSFDETVEAVPDGMFENSASLRTLVVGLGLKEIGSRAFAGCTNLSCVFVDYGKPFDIYSDTFEGAASNLTCVFQHSYGDTQVRRNAEPWSRVLVVRTQPAYEPEVNGDLLCAIGKDGVRLLRYLGEPTDVLKIPATISGRPVTTADNTFFEYLGGVRALDFPSTIQTDRQNYWNCRGEVTFFFRGNIPHMYNTGNEKSKVFAIGPWARSDGGWGMGSIEILPEWADPASVVAGGIAEESGWRYLKGDGFACILKYSGPGEETMKIPESVGGLPVEEIGAFALARGGFRRLDLPSSLRRIGDCAFAGCQSLAEVAWNEGLERIGNGAFFACKMLDAGKLPESVDVVGMSAFDSVASAPMQGPGARTEGGDVKHRITVSPPR